MTFVLLTNRLLRTLQVWTHHSKNRWTQRSFREVLGLIGLDKLEADDRELLVGYVSARGEITEASSSVIQLLTPASRIVEPGEIPSNFRPRTRKPAAGLKYVRFAPIATKFVRQRNMLHWASKAPTALHAFRSSRTNRLLARNDPSPN